jgi:hypothetical protein
MIEETAQTQLDVRGILLTTAPLFFAIILGGMTASKLLIHLSWLHGSRDKLTEEIRTVIWYSVGFQLITLFLGHLLISLVVAAFPPMSRFTGSPWELGRSFLLGYIYIGQPLLVGVGFAMGNFPASWTAQIRWDISWKIFVTGLTIVASTFCAFAGVVFLALMYGLYLDHDSKLPASTLPASTSVTLAPASLPNGTSVSIDVLPDGTGTIRLTPMVYNASNYPIYFDHTFGVFTPGESLTVAAEIDTMVESNSLVVVPSGALQKVNITSRCNRACMSQLRKNRGFVSIMASYRSPENRFSDVRFTGWMKIDWNEQLKKDRMLNDLFDP